MVDNRYPVLQPRTKQSPDNLNQPIGWTGLDPIGNRTIDPVRTFETPLVFFPQDMSCQ